MKRNFRKIKLGKSLVFYRKIIQGLALIGFMTLFLLSQSAEQSNNIINIPARLDPLLILAQILSNRTFLAGSSLALLVVLLTLVFGRVWCGWICPIGTTLDLVTLNKWRGKRQPPGEVWRSIKYNLLIVTLVAALLGNLTLLFLDPFTIWLRTMTVAIWPGVDRIVTSVETFLYAVPWMSESITVFDRLVRPDLLPLYPAFYRDSLVFAGFFLGIILLNVFAPRFWCRYLCPLGGLLGIISKVALFKRQVRDNCRSCALCVDVCPTGTIDPENGYRSDPGECTICMKCVDVCARKSGTFQAGFSTSEWNRYNPGRREVLSMTLAAVGGVVLSNNAGKSLAQSSFLLRPPGAAIKNVDLVAFSNCVRCGECIRACPTQALQPAVFEAGLAGIGTPLFVMRSGFCDYACNTCGQICPVEAIPPLALPEKRQQKIGSAYINQNRCIPWSEHTPCVVCLEMCPLPQKAVVVEEVNIANGEGNSFVLQLPRVDRSLCIGCGICEFQCPVPGEAAIRVNNTIIL